MNIFVDCEFNGYRGGLLSMALVAENGDEWYQIYENNEEIDPWVEKNVVPSMFWADTDGRSIGQFLNQFDEIHVIADWPDDIKYFCECLITGPGLRHDTPPLTMEILRDIDSTGSVIPHNALADARAIRQAYHAKTKPPTQ